MRKSVSPSPGSEAPNQARVFGIPLEELQPAGLPGHQVPLLVQHIVDYIEEHGRLDLEGMFLVNGNAERVNWLRQRYDSGEEVDLEKEADLASAVSLLRLFLQELPEPIIPAALQTHILQRYQDYSSEEEQTRNMKYFLQQLPQVNYSLLRFLCRFLSSVASLQEESWSVGGIAAVFGPDIFHLDTEVEGHREQESVSRVLAELLENQEEFFDSEDDDVSTTNDYSSINEQITELLEDEKLEVCEDLPQDGEDAPRSDSPKDNPPSSSHISTTISILPGSADIIERTIRAAVEQHFFDLKTSIDHEISSYQENQEAGPSEKPVTGPVQSHGEEGKSDAEDPCSPDQETPQIDQLAECSQDTHKDSECHSAALEEGSGMDLDAEAAEALVDAENNINTARQDSQSCETMEQADIFTCGQGSCECDQNANSDTRPYRSCRRANSHAHQLHLNCAFPDSQWEAPPPSHHPFIDFSCMHLQKEGNDPVPSYQSWQDEGEGGEAQLSPLAGRMVPPPLEDDAPPLLARRFLDFHSQRFLQQDHDSPATTKTLPCGRPRRASFSSRDSVRADSVSHQLTRKLHNLKNKMKQFEEQFEKERNYKPSHADKAANPQVLKWMTDLTKIRKQIKDNKHKVEVELGPLTRPRSNTLPKSFGSTLEHAAAPSQEPPPAGGGGSGGGVRGQPRPTREETLGLIQSRMQGKREEDGWPLDVKKMTKEQLSCEKTVLQKNLLHYEGLHGRPATRQERLVVRPLYDRYRLVKQMLTRASIIPITVSPSSKRRSQILQPIIEGETSHFCDEIEEVEEEEGEELQSSGSQVIVSLNPLAPPTSQTEREGPIRSKMEEASGKLALDLRLSSSNASSMPDLLEQLWKTRADKKRLRKTIREFEDDFHQHNGRAVQKEDRVPMLEEYKEYKRIKAKLRLLEVLISKQDSSKSI